MKRTRWAGLAMIGAILLVATGCPPFFIGDPGVIPTTTPLLAVGAHHTCVQNGAVFCWGDNSAGQLGDGTTTSSSTPVEVPGVTWASTLAAGGDRTCAIAGVDHNVWCWGDNSTGGLGDGTTTNRSVPTKVVGLIDMQTVAVGDDFTCATRTAGGVVCWGQVPGVDGGFTTTPVPVAGLETARQVSVGADHACSIVSTTVWCFGDNSDGQLGDGTTTSSAAPVAVAALSGMTDPVSGHAVGVDSVVAGGNHTCAVASALATYWCWGDNASGELGDGTTTNNPVPQPVPYPSLTPTTTPRTAHLALGDAFSCIEFDGGVETDGTDYAAPAFGCWGDNTSGQLADGTNTSNPTYRTNPMDILAGRLAAGGSHACEFAAISAPKPLVRCWGDNSSGELGNGTTTSSTTMVDASLAYSNDPAPVKPANPAPKVTFTRTPKTLVAGQPATFVLHITHPVGLISVTTNLSIDLSQTLPDSFGCGDDAAVWTGTDTDRTITINCTIPIDAPGGTWSFSAHVRAVDSPLYDNLWEFPVTGTSTDMSGPVEVGQSQTPDPVPVGGTVTLFRQFSEPHGPVSINDFEAPFPGWSCGTPTMDGSAAPIYTLTVTCVVGSALGQNDGLILWLSDKFGFKQLFFLVPNIS